MKLEQISAIAETVAAVAVVISLIYVATEVQQNTRAQNAATFQEISRDVRDIIVALPVEVRMKVRNGEQITPVEEHEYLAFVVLALRAYESWWQQRLLGTISDEVFESYITHMHITLRDKLARDLVQNGVIEFLPGFKAYVDSYTSANPLEE